VFAHYFGLQSEAADAFNAAFRIPNFLQNLFGEGALSASFIPVYARLLSRGQSAEADRIAGIVGSLLALVVSAIVALGVLLAPVLTAVVAPGFSGSKRELTVTLVRVLFPGAALLVLSAWCLGVLNSHRRFLLSYAAPVVWNVAMIATLLVWGPGSSLPQLAVWLAWGSVAGSALQFAVQLPVVLLVAPNLRPGLQVFSAEVQLVVRNFVPVFFSRGVLQTSAYIDGMIASLLPTGAVTGLANAQLLYTLPVSVFGMSVAAAELPAMAGEASRGHADFGPLRARLDRGLRQIAYFVVPSAMILVALGDVVAAAVLQTGRFVYADAVYVWMILGGAALGLLPATLGRLYSSAFYALGDTRTPFRYALVHVGLAAVLGYVFAVPLVSWLGLEARLGAAGLTVSASLAAWVELLLLRRSLNARIGLTGLPTGFLAVLWAAATAAAAVAWGAKIALPPLHPVVVAIYVLAAFTATFGGATIAMRVPEATALLARVTGRRIA
jgi:putative peptidoglycan lipid II flippase